MTDIRTAMKHLMVATIHDQNVNHTWTYAAVRPMPVPPTWKPGQKVKGDCSKGCQYLAKWAGSKVDPMGTLFAAYGNSATMTVYLPHVARPSDLEVGDYITFGPAGEDHAACIMEKGADPLLWSFGHQGAPNSYRLSLDRRERHYLHNPVKVELPTPQEKLRAKTGYWSWLQWRLGEGAWKHYEPHDKTVRPDVPKRIPLRWFRRYARFLRRRKAANNPTT